MDRALNRLVEIASVLRSLGAQRRRPGERYSDSTIVLVFYLSVLNNQTRAWACRSQNWPLRRPPGGLPSPSRFSRRINSPEILELLDRVEAAVRARDPIQHERVAELVVDGRPLVIGPNSHDRHSGFGRAAGVRARGYKLHLIIDQDGRGVAWRLSPMNTDEREMLRRMLAGPELSGLGLKGYLLADRFYDSNALFALARERGLQLVVPRRYGTDKGMGHRKHDPARRRCRDLLENTVSEYGRQMYARRWRIESVFGAEASTPELLTHLPAWVRGRRRTHAFVKAKLVIQELHRQARRHASDAVA